MSLASFVINNRFLIDPTRNLITDSQHGTQSRVEPRLMEVLCLLASRSNQTVTREELIKAVWKDFGSGEEGLNQAISFLRKSLDDSAKQLIETVPKRGYVLKATLVYSPQSAAQPQFKELPTQPRNRRVYWPILLLLGMVMAYWLYSRLGEKSLSSARPGTLKDNRYPSSDSRAKPKATPRPAPRPSPAPSPHPD